MIFLVGEQCKHLLAAMIGDVLEDSMCPKIVVPEPRFVELVSSFTGGSAP